MKKNRKVVYVCPPTLQQIERAEWRELTLRVLVLPFVPCIVWGVLAAAWVTGDNLDPCFVTAWSVPAAGAVALTVWVGDCLLDQFCVWFDAYQAVQSIPRNRRVRSPQALPAKPQGSTLYSGR